MLIDMAALLPVLAVPQSTRYVRNTLYFSEMKTWEVGTVGTRDSVLNYIILDIHTFF